METSKFLDAIASDDSNAKLHSIGFVVTGNAFADEDAVKLFIDKRGYNKDLKILFKAIFIDKQISLKLCAKFKLIFNSLNKPIHLEACILGTAPIKGYLPHPYISRYRDIGAYYIHASECIRDRDYNGLLKACSLACSAIDFRDYLMVGKLIEDLIRGYNCIELENGSVVSAAEAISLLKEGKYE